MPPRQDHHARIRLPQHADVDGAGVEAPSRIACVICLSQGLTLISHKSQVHRGSD